MSLVDRWLALYKQDGQTFVEYALILASVVVGVLMLTVWTGVATVLQTAVDAVTAAF
jgi:Flp pilus assembly pilin Flp